MRTPRSASLSSGCGSGVLAAARPCWPGQATCSLAGVHTAWLHWPTTGGSRQSGVRWMREPMRTRVWRDTIVQIWSHQSRLQWLRTAAGDSKANSMRLRQHVGSRHPCTPTNANTTTEATSADREQNELQRRWHTIHGFRCPIEISDWRGCCQRPPRGCPGTRAATLCNPAQGRSSSLFSPGPVSHPVRTYHHIHLIPVSRISFPCEPRRLDGCEIEYARIWIVRCMFHVPWTPTRIA